LEVRGLLAGLRMNQTLHGLIADGALELEDRVEYRTT
jgi:hypothetical protein